MTRTQRAEELNVAVPSHPLLAGFAYLAKITKLFDCNSDNRKILTTEQEYLMCVVKKETSGIYPASQAIHPMLEQPQPPSGRPV